MNSVCVSGKLVIQLQDELKDKANDQPQVVDAPPVEVVKKKKIKKRATSKRRDHSVVSSRKNGPCGFKIKTK